MANISEIEPVEIIAGDTTAWKRTDLPDYPATTWTLKYAFRGPSVQNITAGADGINYSIVITAATTAVWAVGEYVWEAYVTKGSGASLERYKVDSGTLTVKPNLEAITGQYDGRSDTKIAYDNAMEIWMNVKTYGSYTISGRTYTSRHMTEIIQLVEKCKRDLMTEQMHAKYKKTGINPRHIKVRFNR